MAASAVVWLLAGRQGLTQPQQFALVHQAEETVARLTVGRPSPSLARAEQQLSRLVELLWQRTRSKLVEAEFLHDHAEDFAKWKLELAEDNEVDGESTSS